MRDLKAAKAEKSAVDEEVTKLLTLKRQLTLAQGQDPNAKPGKGGKASGKKKKVRTCGELGFQKITLETSRQSLCSKWSKI